MDNHVLEETVSRVSELTRSIMKQVNTVEQVSRTANKALGPASQQSRALGQYRDNLLGLTKVYEQIEQATRDVNESEVAIKAGPAKSGWQNYVAHVQRAQDLSNELALSPELKRFPQLPESAKTQFQFGISQLISYVRKLGKAVFMPVEGAEFISTGEMVPQFKPDELKALSLLVAEMQKWPDTAEGTDNALQTAVETFYTRSLASVLPHMGSKAGQYSPQAVNELIEQYKETVNNGLGILFSRDQGRLRWFAESNAQMAQRMSASAHSHYKNSLAPSHTAKTGPGASRAAGAAGVAGAAGAAGAAGEAAAGASQEGGSAKTGPQLSPKKQRPDLTLNTNLDGAHQSDSHNSPATAGPRTAEPRPTPRDARMDSRADSQFDRSTPGAGPGAGGPMTPQVGTPTQPMFQTPKQGTPRQSTPMQGTPMQGTPMQASSQLPSIAVSSPNSSGSLPIAQSPLTGAPGGGTTTSAAQQWAPLEALQQSRNMEFAADDLARAKKDALTTLVNVFTGIETITRRSPITSEFGVSGASIQFMQTLKQLSMYPHGVDVVLSEIPTRGYLSKPAPMWAQRTEPTAAGRANPVSQYNADILDCLYANLHQVSTEQLKDKTRTGVFLLTNLSAIEHYITDTKDQTLQTVTRKSEIMDSMGDVALQRFQRLIDLSFKDYLTDWSKLAPVLMESTNTTGTNQGKLSNKDREVVKEKFRTFNSEFEALSEKQRKYQVADPVLRARMGQEVRRLIVPLYTRFYQKHSSGDFTKNLQKYVKYDIDALNRALSF